MEEANSGLEQKIRKLDTDLLKLKEQMARLPAGPARESIKGQAMRLLQQKKTYEAQLGMRQATAFNVEQTAFAVENSKSTIETVSAMKAGAKELKQAYAQMRIEDVEDVQDELQELMIESTEVQELLGRSFEMPGQVDEADLEAELEALGDEVELDASYLDTIKPSTTSAVKTSTTGPQRASPLLQQ